MLANTHARNDFGERLLRLDTLVRLRWLAVAGQTAAVLVVHFGLGFAVPLAFVFALIALSAWLNLFLKLARSKAQRLPQRWAAILLGYDILQLAGLLYLTGGLGNPFAFLLLVPVTVSATALPPRDTLILGAIATLAASFLALYQVPLPWKPGEVFELPQIYQFGVWVALLATLAFIAVYTFQVAAEARQLAQALAATELVLEREQHLHALDGLAAAAAHELGTPLATVVLTAKEVETELPADSPLREDVALIRAQGDRCRQILRKLTSLSGDDDFFSLKLSHLVEEVVGPHRDFGIAIEIRREAAEAEPVGRRNPAILYGLGNLVENAVDFAAERVTVTLSWNPSTVSIVIADDGPGFAAEVIDRIGEPYVTTRAPAAARPVAVAAQASAGGLGLGFFIAKTLLERTGARLSLRNGPTGGAIVQIRWPRPLFERGGAPAFSVSGDEAPD